MNNQIYIENLTYVAFLSLAAGQYLGTGFIMTHNGTDYLITAKHVLYKDERLLDSQLTVTTKSIKDDANTSFIFGIDLNNSTILHNMVNDVAIIPLPSRNNYESSTYIEVYNNYPHHTITVDSRHTRGINDIKSPNQVYLIGFPTSLLFNEITRGFDITSPLFRRGIIAGYNTGDNTFIIDCFAYHGNSGGPVLEICEDNTIRIIGIVSRYVPFWTLWKNNRESSIEHTEYSNSGYTVCVSMNAILGLISN
jgi:hypothetical protein